MGPHLCPKKHFDDHLMRLTLFWYCTVLLPVRHSRCITVLVLLWCCCCGVFVFDTNAFVFNQCIGSITALI